MTGEPPVAAGASGPIFDLVCAPGRCAPFADNQCRTVLRRATLDAIALANNAADKLSADNPDPETTRLFRAFFGHDPSRPIPWADNQPSRLSVASRFRSCARELNGGRRTQYSCVCAANAPAGRRGETHSPLDVRLCERLWTLPLLEAGWPAGFRSILPGRRRSARDGPSTVRLRGGYLGREPQGQRALLRGVRDATRLTRRSGS
jgi:hypothetical protein